MNLDVSLAQLETAQLIRRADDAERTYQFKHALVQDTAYQSLLKQDRKHLHRVVGEALEEMYAGQLDEHAAVLAHHFAEAGERDKATACARRAARRSLTRYAVEEAVHQLETALTWIESDQSSELHLALIEETGDANRLLRNGGRTLALYQQAIDLWNHREGADRWNVMRLHRKIIQAVIDVKWAVGVDFMRRANRIGNASRASLETELILIQGAAPQAEMAETLTALSMGAWRLPSVPDWDAAEQSALAAVAMAEQLSDPIILSHALDALAGVYDGRSRLREHLQVALRRLAITQSAEFDDRREKIDALRGVGMAQMYLGEYAQALPPLRDAENLAESIQAIELQTHATGLQAQCLFRLDRWDEVLALEKKWRPLVQRYSRERVGVT
jgi:hypothetical protein